MSQFLAGKAQLLIGIGIGFILSCIIALLWPRRKREE